MKERVSGTVKAMPESEIRKMLTAAGRMEDVIHFEIGDPDFRTPAHIIDAAMKAARDGFTHYTATAGLPEVREAAAAKFERDNGIKCDPLKQVIITVGAVGALNAAIMTLLNPGDEVIVTDPCWSNYLGQIAMARGVAVKVPLREELGFTPDLDEIRAAITPRTRVILMNTPNNPCGSVVPKETMLGIGEIAIEHDLTVICDEVYEKILYDGNEHFSLASDPRYADRVVTVNACSKTYAMTGWRAGFATGPADVIAGMTKVQESSSSCVSMVVQKAIAAALNGPQDEAKKMVETYTRRRDLIVDGLNKIPEFKTVRPGGAFYAFPNISAFGMGSLDFAMMLLNEARVAVVHGSGLGDSTDAFVRMAFCISEDDIAEGLRRMAKWAEGRRK